MKPILLRATAIFLLCSGGTLVPLVYADRASSEEARQSDAELNRVYQKALTATPDPDASEKLVKSQRAWITFRNAEMEMMQKDGLALDETSKQSHLAKLNSHRMKELLGIIKFIQ